MVVLQLHASGPSGVIGALLRITLLHEPLEESNFMGFALSLEAKDEKGNPAMKRIEHDHAEDYVPEILKHFERRAPVHRNSFFFNHAFQLGMDLPEVLLLL